MHLRQLRRAASRPVALAVALASTLVIVSAAAPAVAEPRLTQVSGAVEIGRGEPPAWSAAAQGDVLAAGDAVRTGRGGRAEIELGSGVVRLYEHSLLRLPADAMRPDGAAAAAEIDRGSSLFDVRPRRASDPFEVRTPEVVASVKGTRFGVQCGRRAAAISVYAGLVGVHGRSAALGAETLVRPGFAAIGGMDRALELSLLRHDDPWTAWSGGAAAPATPLPLGAPAPDQDGAATDPQAEGAKTAIAEAREAAQQAAAPEVLAAAAERRPELVREIRAQEAAQKDGDTDSRGAGMVPAAMADDLVGDVPSVDPARATAAADRSAVDHLEQRAEDGGARALQERVAESLLNGTAPAAGGSGASGPGGLGSLGLTLQYVTSGGPNRVVITAPDGTQLSMITEAQLNAFQNSGNPAVLGPALLAMLQSKGVNPILFAQQLAPLFH